MSRTANAVRRVLRQYPDGLTVPQLRTLLPYPWAKPTNIHGVLRRMPDAYIDRWAPSNAAGGMSPVFVAVDVPEDAPKPAPLRRGRR